MYHFVIHCPFHRITETSCNIYLSLVHINHCDIYWDCCSDSLNTNMTETCLSLKETVTQLWMKLILLLSELNHCCGSERRPSQPSSHCQHHLQIAFTLNQETYRLRCWVIGISGNVRAALLQICDVFINRGGFWRLHSNILAWKCLKSLFCDPERVQTPPFCVHLQLPRLSFGGNAFWDNRDQKNFCIQVCDWLVMWHK